VACRLSAPEVRCSTPADSVGSNAASFAAVPAMICQIQQEGLKPMNHGSEYTASEDTSLLRSPAPQAPVPESAGVPPPTQLAEAERSLLWVNGVRNWRRNREVVTALALPYFGGQRYQVTAAQAGISPGRLQSFYYKIDLPRWNGRPQLGRVYDEEVAWSYIQESGYELAVCRATGCFFFRHRRDRAKVVLCRDARRARGLLEPFSRCRAPSLD